MGPNLLWHLGGGDGGGIQHFIAILMDPMFALTKDLGNPQMTAELRETIIKGVIEEAENRYVEKLATEENEMLHGLRLRAKCAKY